MSDNGCFTYIIHQFALIISKNNLYLPKIIQNARFDTAPVTNISDCGKFQFMTLRFLN